MHFSTNSLDTQSLEGSLDAFAIQVAIIETKQNWNRFVRVRNAYTV